MRLQDALMQRTHKHASQPCLWMPLASFVWSLLAAFSVARDPAGLPFQLASDRVIVSQGATELATYRFHDPVISRPYFCTLRTPTGLQVTRNHPPIPEQDLVDHDLFHPGLWLAFGDLDGADCWRLKAPVRHEKFMEAPHAIDQGVGWTALNTYLRDDGQTPICQEVNALRLVTRPNGVLLLWDSTFRGERDFYFGDQEELGLGLRVATPISVKQGGKMVNSAGAVNESEVWGRQADWCAYQGKIDRHNVGVVLMPHPGNVRPSWFHARDYGFVAANPFGRQAFTGGEKSRIDVPAGEDFKLRYGVFWYDAGDEEVDVTAVYDDYVKTVGK